MPQTHSRKVFISYAWENQPIARQLQRDLQNDGVEVFVDYAELKGGDSLPARISKALDWCDTLVLLWSKDAAQSRWVAREWECAEQLEKCIIPCKLDGTVLPALLRSRLYLDFANYENGYAGLCRALSITQAPKDQIKKQFLQEPIAKPTTGGIKKGKHENVNIAAQVVGAVAAVITTIVSVLLFIKDDSSSPRFGIINSQITPDSVVTIIAANKAASRSAPLNIQFDGLLFNGAGKVIPKSNPQQWMFRLKDHNPVSMQTVDGNHQMRVGFLGMELSEPFEIVFPTAADAPRFKIKNLNTSPDSVIVIILQNEAVFRPTSLNVEFDEIFLINAGQMIRGSKPRQWNFRLKEHNPPAALLRNGIHRMRVGFPGTPFSDFFEITFY